MDWINSGRVRTFVRRQGKISSAQKRSYENLLPVFGLIENETVRSLDSRTIFGNEKPLVIEIGFGMGTATAFIANENPGINYLGIEVHKPGIGRLLSRIEKLALENIRIIEGDAVEIIERRIPDKSVSAFHIFFPDPWPKTRHHKRRLITRPFTDLLTLKLLSGGYIYFVSDWEDYGNWALAELSATPGLKNKYSGFAEHMSWRPETEFERKGLQKNHKVKELFFIKP